MGTLLGRRAVGDVGEKLLEHGLARDTRGEPVAAAHHAKALPFAQLRGEAVKLRGPLRGDVHSGRVRGKVQASVEVSGEAGEGVTLFADAGLNQLTGRLAQFQVFTPEPVEPE
jgi:hypothetical protein